jgi:phosphate transport system permease protein
VQRNLERLAINGLCFCAVISVVITILIFTSVAMEAYLFFDNYAVVDFLFGTKWSPQTAIRAGQSGSSGNFGFLPLLCGTLMITIIALCVAVPVGLYTAIYMNEYANPRLRSIAKPLLEVLAGIPTVVYGFFAINSVAPFLQNIGDLTQMHIASESALAAGLVMGVMMIPLMSSMSDDAIKTVPRTLKDASLALGATRSETIKKVVLPAALSGIMGGVLLATSRAIGETMIVVMAAGLSANLTYNPLESVTTITVQIVALLGGEQDFGSNKTLAAFALGLTLFIFTLILNIIALLIVKRYRQEYE